MSETANTQAETGKKGKMSARELTTLGLLTGVLLLMSVTPLGYFHTFGLDISLMMVPVAIGAMLMGPKAGMAGADFRRNQLLSGGDRLLCVQHDAV